MRFLCSLSVLLINLPVLLFTEAQAQKITISGYVRDLQSGENLIGAAIHSNKINQGTTTNAYGFYSLTLPADSIGLSYSYVGYQRQIVHLLLRKDTLLNIGLQSSPLLNEVVVTGSKIEMIQESSGMGTISLPITQIKAMPALMGEVDLMKVLQLLPGVQAGSEGSSGLYVRGGGADQNLILLDGVPVYNASHLYGFFSTFNADAINHVELVKGGFPARYGGRLSSVVDISMKEGNSSEFHGQASLGIIASKFMVEGPIKKDKTSFIVSARRSYLNLLKSSIISKSAGGITDNYFFYDLNAKINHKINNQNRVFLSMYSGDDKAGTSTKDSYSNVNLNYKSNSNSKLSWGNTIAATRWNHIFNKKLFSNISATYSRYNFQVFKETFNRTNYPATGITENQFYKYDYRSDIRDFAGRIDFDFIPNPSHYFRFGLHAINHQFTPGVLALTASEAITANENEGNSLQANELSTYIEDDWEITDKLKVNVGLHASTFLVEDKTYPSLQPRISARFLASPEWSLKASFATMQQNIHLLTNAGIGLPTDLWVPATATIKPQTSVQGVLGFARTFKDEYEFSIEGYYKKMNNLIEYKDGASYLNVDQDWQTKVEIGKGDSYGTEFFLHKKLGKINGWIGYTLSWSKRQFANLNGGKTFPYRYDRRHDAKIAVSYIASEWINVGLTWVYGTGNAVSVPLEMYGGDESINSQFSSSPFITYYQDRNDFRMRDYHRLDLSASYSIVKKRVEHQFTFSLYNAYNRRNPFYLQFGFDKGEKVLKQVSLFPILPAVSYSIKF